MKGRTALLLLGGLVAFAWLRKEEAEPVSVGVSPPAGLSADDREVLSLARMLASETSDPRAQVAVGWITVHASRSWGKSLYRLLTGSSGLFGPQKLWLPNGTAEIRYASTAKKETAETTRIARGLLDGSIHPPDALEKAKPTAYVELSKASKQTGPDGKPLQPEYTADKILAKQTSYGGIVGRLNNWFFYAKGAPALGAIDQAPLV
jgi:hypothetical protein